MQINKVEEYTYWSSAKYPGRVILLFRKPPLWIDPDQYSLMAEMPNLKLSEEVHANTELQPRRHPVAPLRLDRDAVVELDPGDAVQ